MTKFIFHGGETKVKNVHNQNYFNEIVKGLKSPVKGLEIPFARQRDKWQSGVLRDKKKFQRNLKDNKKVELDLASEKSSILRQQIKKAEVVFIIGGLEMKCLKENLKKIKDFKQLIKGKVVAGSSAGAYVLSQYYYTHGRARVEEGLGILPVKTIAHYEKEKDKGNLKKLSEKNGQLKIIKIPETQYVVINKVL
ncbi:MAG: Type 1 glutamine amidotransferase-like domain-containing protein [Patescibacteria group bacterium]|nr:Type 1 glutamine amidotransferase-like domain-containing protein [Patescibacteria group bacterium]